MKFAVEQADLALCSLVRTKAALDLLPPGTAHARPADSLVQQHSELLLQIVPVRGREHISRAALDNELGNAGHAAREDRTAERHCFDEHDGQDRKSTRLNSSL